MPFASTCLVRRYIRNMYWSKHVFILTDVSEKNLSCFLEVCEKVLCELSTPRLSQTQTYLS